MSYDTEQGDATFPFGAARFRAGEGVLAAEVSDRGETALARARAVIDVHLKTCAFREKFE